MKFADKLFFGAVAVFMTVFAIFGVVLLSTYFQKMLNRELEQSGTESRMFQYLFEMAYPSASEYGEEVAVSLVMGKIMNSLQKDGNRYFVINEAGEFLYRDTGEQQGRFDQVFLELKEGLEGESTYVRCVHPENEKYYLLSLCAEDTGKSRLYLGMCKDMTQIYKDRQSLMNQYRLALLMMILAGGASIYFLSRYMTGPIRKLEKTAARIASGNYEIRSDNLSKDEIGELSRSFNRMADKLVEQMEEKRQEARQKEDFTLAFAHELKTPLTSIIGYADTLNSVELSEKEQREAYYYIYSQGKRLESLSHKLLELMSIEMQPFHPVPISTLGLEKNLRSTMRPIFKENHIKGKITMEKGVIYGDSDLLLSLLYNLLDNARKAVSEDGFILLKGENTENGYEIRVVDNGRGIPEEELTRITEAFYMVDKSRSRKEGGAGIGMALCEKIVKRHNAVWKIESKPGEGTEVWLRFPESMQPEKKEEAENEIQ